MVRNDTIVWEPGGTEAETSSGDGSPVSKAAKVVSVVRFKSAVYG